MKLYKACQTKENTWAGGISKELFIYPNNSSLKNRNFTFRISSATSNLKVSDFSDFTGYDRILMVLEGHIKLVHNNSRHVSLGAYEQDHFDGEDITQCYGTLRDFNVIVRRGVHQSLEVIDLQEESLGFVPAHVLKGDHFIFLYCSEGSVEVSNNHQTETMQSGDLLSIESHEEEYEFTSNEKAKLLVVHIVI